MDMEVVGRARLIAAAISVVLSATVLVVLLFDSGRSHVQPRRGPVQPAASYVLLSESGEPHSATQSPNPWRPISSLGIDPDRRDGALNDP